MKDYAGGEWMLFDSVEWLQHSIIIIQDYFNIWWIGGECAILYLRVRFKGGPFTCNLNGFVWVRLYKSPVHTILTDFPWHRVACRDCPDILVHTTEIVVDPIYCHAASKITYTIIIRFSNGYACVLAIFKLVWCYIYQHIQWHWLSINQSNKQILVCIYVCIVSVD